MSTKGDVFRDDARVDTLTPKELMQLPRSALTVPRGATVHAGPGDQEMGRCAYAVSVRSFEDLQVLTLISPRVREDSVLAALREDDEAAHTLAERHLDAVGCGCEKGNNSEKPSFVSAYRGAYNQVRRTQHRALARHLSEVQNAHIAWDSLDARFTYRLVSRLHDPLFTRRIWSLLFSDITVDTNATLALSTATTLLLANDVRVHRNGKIASGASFLKFTCASFAGNLA